MLRVRGLRDERDLPVAVRLACGAAAGTTGQTVAYPLDVVRRRMQMSGWAGATGLHHEAGGGAVAYKGMVDCFRRTVAEEGPRALFKGLWPNYVKVGDGGRGRGGEKGASCAFFVSTAAHASPSPPPRPCAGRPVHRHRVCVVRAAQGGHGRAAAHFQLRRREGRGGGGTGGGGRRAFFIGGPARRAERRECNTHTPRRGFEGGMEGESAGPSRRRRRDARGARTTCPPPRAHPSASLCSTASTAHCCERERGAVPAAEALPTPRPLLPHSSASLPSTASTAS